MVPREPAHQGCRASHTASHRLDVAGGHALAGNTESETTIETLSAAASFGDLARKWLQQRSVSGRTREHYPRLLDKHILPAFANLAVCQITPDIVATWYANTAVDTPSVRLHAYSLLRSITRDAPAHNIIDASPCQITGVSTSLRAESARPATVREIEEIATAMPEAYQSLILMAAWLAMPFSELGELRRKDIDLRANLVRVRRAVALVDRRFQVTTPTSIQGIRDISIPPSLAPRITAHLRHHVQSGREALLFPAVRDRDRHLSPSALYPMFGKARLAAGRPDLRVPDLRRSRDLLNDATAADRRNC